MTGLPLHSGNRAERRGTEGSPAGKSLPRTGLWAGPLLLLVLLHPEPGRGEPLWRVPQPGDACMTLVTGPDFTGDGRAEILAGYDSGLVACWSGEATTPTLALWTASTSGTVLAILPVPDTDGDGRDDVAVADDLGNVRCLRGGNASDAGIGQVLWSFQSACGVAVLTTMADFNADGVADIAVGGAEQVLWLLSGKTGTPIWTRPLSESNGYGYVHRILDAGDLNGDGRTDLAVLDWNGYVRAFGGVDGAALWARALTSGFTEAMDRMGDLTGDGKSEFVVGGNNKMARVISGADGTVRWSCSLGRPIRAALAVPDLDDDGTTDCLAATAGGLVACISGGGTGTKTPRWAADVGDVCRALASPGDLDADGKADAVVGAENGVVAAFSGADGAELWHWQGPDVVRALAVLADVDGDGKADVAVACLDGTVAVLPGNPDAWSGAASAGAPVSRASRPVTSWIPPDETDHTAPECLPETMPRATAAPDADAGLLAVAPLPAAAQEPNATQIALLLYHDVVPVAKYPYSVPVANFRAQMDLLVSGGFTCVSLDQLADWIEGTITLPERSVCITFDGPYEGHHTHAYPILKERGLFAESYITADWIGTVNHADWHQLREMDADGVQLIENHTINHPALTSVSRDEAIAQLTLCNESIRRHLNGKIVRHHAYPGGSYNETVIGILAELGFRTATTVEARRATRSDRLLALPRFSIVPTTSLGSFKSWIGYTEPAPPPLPYQFAGTVGTGWSQPSFGDVDAQGRLWVCDYAGARVRVFEPTGAEASFSPITQGKNQAGQTKTLKAVSGIAVTPTGEVLITLADYMSNPIYFGLLKYRASDGAFLAAMDLAYRPGDVDCDAAGRVFVLDKVTDEWHVYSPAWVELAGSPIGPGTTNHIQRGISVRPDASRVYVISESDGAVHVWNGTIDETGCHYTQGYDLVTGLGGASGGVDVLDDGTVLVGDDLQGRVLAFDANHALLGALSGGSPALVIPRGCAFTPDGSVIWAISRSGFVQKWIRVSRVDGWLCY